MTILNKVKTDYFILGPISKVGNGPVKPYLDILNKQNTLYVDMRLT